MLNNAARTETTDRHRTPFFSEMDLWVLGTYIKTAFLAALMIGFWIVAVGALAYGTTTTQQTMGDAQWLFRAPAAAIACAISVYIYFLIQRFWDGPPQKNVTDYIVEDLGL